MTGSNVFTFLSGKRAVVNDEVHRDGRLGDLLEWNWFRSIRRAYRITDMDICNTGDRYDGSDSCLIYFNFIQAIKFIKLTDLDFFVLLRIVSIDNDNILIDLNRSVADFADTDTADIFIIVNGADQSLSRSIRITFRCRDVFNDRFKERLHILAFFVKFEHGDTGFCGSIDERTVKLFIGSVQINEKFKYFINNFIGTCFRTVNLVDADNNSQIKFQRFL